MYRLLAVVLLCVVWAAAALASGENDTPIGASTVSLNGIARGTVCKEGDPVDWWKVYIEGPTEIVVFLDGVGGDNDQYFYSHSLDLLAQSTGSGADEVVFGGVSGGWYYIKVYRYSSGCSDYYLGVLSADVSGYLWGAEDIDIYRIYMSAGTTYWIFLTDHSATFNPDLFLATSEHVIARSNSTGNVDVIKYMPSVSGYYYIAVGSASGSGDYWLFVGSR